MTEKAVVVDHSTFSPPHSFRDVDARLLAEKFRGELSSPSDALHCVTSSLKARLAACFAFCLKPSLTRDVCTLAPVHPICDPCMNCGLLLQSHSIVASTSVVAGVGVVNVAKQQEARNFNAVEWLRPVKKNFVYRIWIDSFMIFE